MRGIRELFRPVPLEEMERQPFRPADSLSNFVVEELPNLLNKVRAGQEDISVVAWRAEALATAQLLRVEHFARQGEVQKLLVARLDILMLEAAILKSGGVAGPTLSRLVDKLAGITNRPAGLTYEDVVINNPEQDIRTFSNGLMGNSEADFYNGHRYIEESLEPSVRDLQAVLTNENTVSTEVVIEVLEQVYASFKTLIAYTGTISKKMPEAHFRGGFRMYLTKLEQRGLRGPSGAFTARIPLIEYMLMGETLAQSDRDYQIEELQYFPLTHQAKLVEALHEAMAGTSVRQLLIRRGSPEQGMQLLQKMSEIFRFFRVQHLEAVKKHIPEVFEGTAEGTGGYDARIFLKERIERDHGQDPSTNGKK